MCGDAEYKKVLGEMQTALVWGVFQRKGLKPWLENLFVAIFRIIKPRRQSS
jgi:hypothetical protein